MAKPSVLSASEHEGGRFNRQQSAFRDVPGSFESGRHHLYVCLACPWAHRTLIVRHLKGLDDVLPVSLVDPIRDERGWAFTGGAFTDALHGWSFLSEAYEATQPGFDARVTVPVLWDETDGRIVNNESADVLRILDDWPGATGPDLYPEAFRAEIDAINARVYETVNNGVYRSGFATTQEAYEEAVHPLFESLQWLDDLLGERRFLAGTPEPSEADWRLFTTLVRFDAVYVSHFKCNLRRIVDFPNLWPYLRALYQVPGVGETVDLDQIKRHYFVTHESINPTGIVPAGPELDFSVPAGR